jgi:hypothetical protein
MSVALACNEIHLIKAIPSVKKILYRKICIVDVTFLVPMHMHLLRIKKIK